MTLSAIHFFLGNTLDKATKPLLLLIRLMKKCSIIVIDQILKIGVY